jgi:molybdopterin molybdotransferase
MAHDRHHSRAHSHAQSALPYAEALQMALDAAHPGPVETLALTDAAALAGVAGRVLAETLVGDRDDPPAALSAMDGYALRAADTHSATLEHPRPFHATQVIAAGHAPQSPLAPEPGAAARIMTGAQLPEGADAVAKQEDVRKQEAGGRADSAEPSAAFLVSAPLASGENVIPRGARMRRGEQILAAGEMLGPQALGMVAALHRPAVRVYRQPRVAVLAVGDELVGPGQALGPNQIAVTNLHVIVALVRRYGGDPRTLGIAPDDPERILAALQPCLAGGGDPERECDLVLTLGGSHRGDRDFVHAVLERAGAMPRFDRVNVTPGGPTIFAVAASSRADASMALDNPADGGTTLVFGLPGSPSAAWGVFEALVRPVLAKLCGRSRWQPPTLAARLGAPVPDPRGRAQFYPCRLELGAPEPVAWPIQGRHAHESRALQLADGLIVTPEQTPVPHPGAWVSVQWVADVWA